MYLSNCCHRHLKYIFRCQKYPYLSKIYISAIKIDEYQVCIFLTRLPNFFSVIAVVWLISEICQSILCPGRHQEGTTSAWCEVVKLRGHDGRRATNTNKKNLCSHWDDPPPLSSLWWSLQAKDRVHAHIVQLARENVIRDDSVYGSVSAGREKWPFNVLFF